MKPDHSATLESIARRFSQSPLVVLELFLERSAIREHEGGFTRDEAERLAIGDVEEALGLPVERAARPTDATGLDLQTCGRSDSVANESIE